MDKLTLYKKSLTRTILVCLIVFSFTPCKVKDVLFDVFDIDFAKSYNVSRSASQSGTCSYAVYNHQKVVSQGKIRVQSNFIDSAQKFLPSVPEQANYSVSSDFFSGTSPPMYILYKRLKIALI